MAGTNKRILLGIGLTIAVILSIAAGYLNMVSSSVVPILMYHSFNKGADNGTPRTDPEIFACQIDFFARNRYNVVGPDKIIAYMTKKEKMPPRTVAITVDDGESNFYEYAYPVLKKYRMPAAIFIIADRVGKAGYLTWDQLREMSGSGLVVIGSHTRSHPWLPSTSVDEQKLFDELAISKDILEKGTGRRVDYLCYPNGAYNDQVRDSAKKFGYKGAFTTNPSKNGPIDDIYAIRRLKMSSSSNNPLILWGKVNRCYAWFKEHR